MSNPRTELILHNLIRFYHSNGFTLSLSLSFTRVLCGSSSNHHQKRLLVLLHLNTHEQGRSGQGREGRNQKVDGPEAVRDKKEEKGNKGGNKNEIQSVPDISTSTTTIKCRVRVIQFRSRRPLPSRTQAAVYGKMIHNNDNNNNKGSASSPPLLRFPFLSSLRRWVVVVTPHPTLRLPPLRAYGRPLFFIL